MDAKKSAFRYTVLVAALLSVSTITSYADNAKNVANYRYHYILAPSYIAVPQGSSNEAQLGLNVSLNDDGLVAGSIVDCSTLAIGLPCESRIVSYNYSNDSINDTGVNNGYGIGINNNNTIAGARYPDPNALDTQLLLVHKNGVETIPDQPQFTTIDDLNNRDAALLRQSENYDGSGPATYKLYKNGKVQSLNFGLSAQTAIAPGGKINDSDIFAGSYGDSNVNGRGFTYNIRSKKTTILQPYGNKPVSLVVDINNGDQVLGWSQTDVYDSNKQAGIWNKNGKFTPYATATYFGDIAFNDNGLIVASGAPDKLYLIPEPGVQLKLNDMVTDYVFPMHRLTSNDQTVTKIQRINNNGDMIGYTNSIASYGGGHGENKTEFFMLKRIVTPHLGKK